MPQKHQITIRQLADTKRYLINTFGALWCLRVLVAIFFLSTSVLNTKYDIFIF